MKEEDEENREQAFIEFLTEMGGYNPDMKFHTVHPVGRPRGKTRGGSYGSKPDNPRHIIARFISRKDRDLIWSQRDEIKKNQNISVMLSSSLTVECNYSQYWSRFFFSASCDFNDLMLRFFFHELPDFAVLFLEFSTTVQAILNITLILQKRTKTKSCEFVRTFSKISKFAN